MYLENVTHRSAKDITRPVGLARVPVPPDRRCPVIWPKETPALILTPNFPPQAMGECLSVAVLTADGDLGTSPPGVERVIEFCDLGVFPHLVFLSLIFLF
jgi:hypothetical protein